MIDVCKERWKAGNQVFWTGGGIGAPMVFMIRRVEKDKRRVSRIGVGEDPAFGPAKKDVITFSR